MRSMGVRYYIEDLCNYFVIVKGWDGDEIMMVEAGKYAFDCNLRFLIILVLAVFVFFVICGKMGLSVHLH